MPVRREWKKKSAVNERKMGSLSVGWWDRRWLVGWLVVGQFVGVGGTQTGEMDRQQIEHCCLPPPPLRFHELELDDSLLFGKHRRHKSTWINLIVEELARRGLDHSASQKEKEENHTKAK